MPQSYSKTRACNKARDLLEQARRYQDQIAVATLKADGARMRRNHAVQQLVAAGVSLGDIAKALQISRSAVKQIADRQGLLT